MPKPIYDGECDFQTAAFRKLFILIFIATFCIVSNQSPALDVSPGDILVADFSQNAIIRVDPTTGDRVVVSSSSVGTGPSFFSPTNIEVESDGSLLVTNRFDFLIRVDPTTGNRTEVSGPNQGMGPEINGLEEIVVSNNGTIFGTDRGFGQTTSASIYQIDPVTGNRGVVSSFTVGTGDFFIGLEGITLDSNQDIFVTGDADVFSVDPLTGNRTRVSGSGIGDGPELLRSNSIEFSPEGRLIVSGNLRQRNTSFPSLFEVDPVTGERTWLSGGTIGAGPQLLDTQGFSFLSENLIVMGQDQTRSLFTIDLETGLRTLISAGENSSFEQLGDGLNFSFPIDVVVYPQIVPEPGTGTLLVVSLIALSSRVRRRTK